MRVGGVNKISPAKKPASHQHHCPTCRRARRCRERSCKHRKGMLCVDCQIGRKNLVSMAVIIFMLLLLSSQAYATCVQISATTQDCIYILTWDWEQTGGDPADGYKMQQQVDNNGIWYDIYQPIPVATKTLTDSINGDMGNRSIAWRVFAYNDAGLSAPSNVAQTTTPAVVTGIDIKTRAGLLPLISRRLTDTNTIISVLINANEVLGPQGVEITYPAYLTLNVSRRATNMSSIVAFLVNKSVPVIVNGQPK